ncbi:germination protein YpeB [Paenibacillus humicola]|uniref:germination protein YpeB n=1 Tax=Paenibacillus humicola TaxID=3110540 RepID=UPI00237C5052|nr:germination protein YpeB [Paenibacillus humicola]
MYQRLSAVLFPVMTLLFIGSIYWGYQEHQEKNSILIKAENQYQRAFHDLSYHMNQLHRELGNTLAVHTGSQGYHRKGLVNVWRLTSQAQNEINQLPLTLLPFNKTEDFLSHISNFAYKTSVRDLTAEPLTKDEYKTLETLYARSDDLTKQLQSVQDKVIANNLRWMDVEIAIASEKTGRDNTIIDGFKTVDKKVSEYPEINWGPSVASMYEKRSVRMLSGSMATPEEIKRKAAAFLNLDDTSRIRVAENGHATEFSSFTATVETGNPDNPIELDYTQKGGKLVSYTNPRTPAETSIGIGEAQKAASSFLEAHGYSGMKPINYDQYDAAAVFTFVGTQDGVYIYPDKLTVKIALDNGEALGLTATDYAYEHHKRTLPKPKLSEAQARKKLNPRFEVRTQRKALIKNDVGQEVLCYEYNGRINGTMYRIYINALTGAEEAVEQMPG